MPVHNKTIPPLRLVALLLALGVPTLPLVTPAYAESAAVVSEARNQLIDQIIQTAGWPAVFDRLERDIRDRAVSDKRLPSMSYERYQTFGLFVRNELVKSKLMASARAELVQGVSGLQDEKLKAYVDAMGQDLPQRMLAVERLAKQRIELGKINRYKLNLQSKAPPKVRLDMVDRYLEASGMRAAYMQDQLGGLKQLLIEAQPNLGEKELAEQMQTLAPELEKKVTFLSRADVLATFREVSDDDLLAYVKVLESPAVADVLVHVTKARVDVSQRGLQSMLLKLGEMVAPSQEDVDAVNASREQAGLPPLTADEVRKTGE